MFIVLIYEGAFPHVVVYVPLDHKYHQGYKTTGFEVNAYALNLEDPPTDLLIPQANIGTHSLSLRSDQKRLSLILIVNHITLASFL